MARRTDFQSYVTGFGWLEDLVRWLWKIIIMVLSALVVAMVVMVKKIIELVRNRSQGH